MKKLIFVLLFGSLFIAPIAQPVIKTGWKANWIGDTLSSVPNTFYKYRHSFELAEIPASAIAAIAADSKYWLWINDRLVVFEGQLKRGPTPNDTYYDEVNIAPFLQKGKNSIAILLWFWGKDGFCHKNSGKAGILFEAAIGSKNVVSDETWKISRHLAFQNSLPPHPNYRLPEHNIRYDARLDNEQWIHSSFDDSKWGQAAIIGKPGQAPWNALWKRPIPLWHDSGLIPYENPLPSAEGKITMKLPKNITITPYFRIEAPAGLLIDIRADNYYGGSEPNVRTEYITREGLQEFESPGYFNGHEVIYSFPAGVKVIDLKYRETKFNTNYMGHFSSSDEFLNTLWIKSANTMNVNMRDAIQDPDRERAQWWGDAVIILEEIFYSCDEKGKTAIQKAISNLLEWQKPDGVLFSPIPAGNWDRELPAQMLASIGKYGIWKYIEHSGDTAMIRYAYPFVKKYMQLWSLNDKGLVNHRAGGWDWHDWGTRIDVPLLDNTWYYMALESCHNMALHLGESNDAAGYQQQMQKIRNAFQQHFWKGNRFVSDDYKFYADDRGNGLAVCAGLVSKEQWKTMKPVLDTVFHAGPYLEKYIMEAYFIMQDAAAGVARMKKRYAEMVSSPVSTLWEGWEVGSGTYGGGSYNHGWSGGPLSLMSGYIAGIRPLEKGYSSYIIKPQPAGLGSISCRILTAKGYMGVDLQIKNGHLSMSVETAAAKGWIAVPKPGAKSKIISVLPKKICRYRYEDEDYWYFECNQKAKIKLQARAL